MTRDSHVPDCRELDDRQRRRYRSSYVPAQFSLSRNTPASYMARQAMVKVEEVRRNYHGGTALDLCCGAGDYAFALADSLERIVGVDFSPEMAASARRRAAEEGRRTLHFCVANARQLPLADASVSLVYSLAALYSIPAVEEVLAEVARVLQPAGSAVLELGALYSLNTLVCRATPDVAEAFHLPVARIRRMLTEAGLSIERDRSFQILPLWGARPLWLKPLLLPFWPTLLKPVIAGRMLDEWLSALPGLRRFAFRHIMICRKGDLA